MFHITPLAGHHYTAQSTINSARVSNGLEPYDAPSGSLQVCAAAALLLITALLILVIP